MGDEQPAPEPATDPPPPPLSVVPDPPPAAAEAKAGDAKGQTPPQARANSPFDNDMDVEEQLEESQRVREELRLALDAVLTFRRKAGYVLIGSASGVAALFVLITLAQMPSMKVAWSTPPSNTEAVVVLAVAHVGVTVAGVFLLGKVLALGERLALPRTMLRHADRLLGRSDPGVRTLHRLAEIIGKTQGGGKA